MTETHLMRLNQILK